MEKVLIHYDEIFLKGNHRLFFEDKLIENIKKSSEHQKVKLVSTKKIHNSIICEFNDSPEKINNTLKSVFGIKDFAYFEEVERDFDKILKKVKEILVKFKKEGNSKVSFNIKRADKNFPLSSDEINKSFRKTSKELGLELDYKGDSVNIYTRIYNNCCYLYTEIIEGYGGLPVGTSGKVLVLLSGGIDSPVAAWNMMKRGCTVDFLHVHNLKTNDEALKSKIPNFIKLLNKYQFKSRLYLLPYINYEMHMMENSKEKNDLVLFKYYIMKIAEKVAIKNGYSAIVNGDNLGQVASQTLNNLKASTYSISTTIFRPLLTSNKEEIVDLAKEIGTYQISIEKYKDCCSLLSKNPNTQTQIKDFKDSIIKTKMDDLIKNTFKEVSFHGALNHY